MTSSPALSAECRFSTLSSDRLINEGEGMLNLKKLSVKYSCSTNRHVQAVFSLELGSSIV